MSTIDFLYKSRTHKKAEIRDFIIKENDLYMYGPIHVEYSYNYPIHELQDIIIARISSNNEINDIREKIEELAERKVQAKSIIEERSAGETILKLEKKVDDLQTGTYLRRFLHETNPVIRHYLQF